MKKSLKKISFGLLLFIVLINSRLSAQSDDSTYMGMKEDVNFFLTLQLMDGNDYASTLKSMGGTGYIHWLAFDIGCGFRIKDNIFLAPRLNILTSRITTGSHYNYSYGTENAKVTLVFIPGVTGRYYFKELGALHLLASVGMVASVSSQVIDYELEGGGIALGCGVGYEFPFGSRALVLEFGYSSIPIKTAIKTYRGYSLVELSSDRNWGGIFFTVGTCFNITNYKP
ncbi:MAG: hypothetical protein HY964_04215 [Ignavibacteriales bacterium]|nr:hypothetical protein [Ignavibacteriales bacterium]